MKILKGKVFTGELLIEDSFIDFRLFTRGKKEINILSRAAVIPLDEYFRLLRTAGKSERLAVLLPLHKALQQREIEGMDNAQIDKNLL